VNDLFSAPTEADLKQVPVWTDDVTAFCSLSEWLAKPDGVYLDCPESTYHKLPYCSSTYLRKLAKNPAAAKIPFEPSASMIIGSAVHKLVLEGREAFNDCYFCIPEIKFHKSSNAYKAEFADYQKEAGSREIVNHDQMEIIEGCSKSVMEHPISKRLLTPTLGQPEVTVIFTDAETGLRSKARVDRLPDAHMRAAIDLKTSSDASLNGFGRSIMKYGYQTQAGLYIHALNSVGIEADTFIFVVVETKLPYQVLVGMLDADFLFIGKNEAQRLLMIEKECRELGFYPNIQIPGHLPSLFDIYNKDGSIKNDADLFEIFTAPKWAI
jgi:hypothetical protein